MAFPLAVRIDVIHKGFVLTFVIGLNAATVENDDAGTDADRRSLGQFADALPGQFWDEIHGYLGALKSSQKNAPEAGGEYLEVMTYQIH